MHTNLTFKQAHASLRAIGISLSKLDDQGNLMDDYRVAFPGPRKLTEPAAYYTDDLQEAVQNGYAMAAWMRDHASQREMLHA